jgi:hypothetical protein
MGRKADKPNKYGYSHRQWARRLPNPEGMNCPRCGLPMYKAQGLDLGHIRDIALGYTGGICRWEHSYCNRSAGAKLGNKLRKGKGYKRIETDHISEQW